PITLSSEEREHRKQFQMKLSGLPRSFKPRKVLAYLHSIKAKAMFIPRSKQSSYHPMNQGFVYFDNQHDMEQATTQFCSYQGTELYWSEPDSKHCFRCGCPGHVAKDCPTTSNKNLSSHEKKIKALQDRFRPNQRKKVAKRSYAEAAKSGQRQQPRNKPNG